MKFRIIKVLIFSTIFTLVFVGMSMLSNNQEFILNKFTTGSDDLRYIINATNALAINDFDLKEIINEISFETEHAYGYPIIIYMIFKVFTPNIFLIIFFNFLILYLIYDLLFNYINMYYELNNKLVLIFLTPGLIWVSMHAFKDILLLYLVLLAIYYGKKDKFTLFIFFSVITELLRPYNSVLMIFILFFCARPKLIATFGVLMTIILFDNFHDRILDAITLSNNYAIRDLNDSGSNFTPGDNIFINYLVGMVRFVLLPTPWGYKFQGFSLIFDLLEFLQSIIIWFTLLISLIKFKKLINVIILNKYLFLYTFMNASIYAIIYYGNAQPRYRIFIYTFCVLILVSIFCRQKTNEK